MSWAMVEMTSSLEKTFVAEKWGFGCQEVFSMPRCKVSDLDSNLPRECRHLRSLIMQRWSRRILINKVSTGATTNY